MGGCLSASFFVFNNLRAVLLGFGDFLYFCGWRWPGCCIRLTSGSWLRSWAALRDLVCWRGLRLWVDSFREVSGLLGRGRGGFVGFLSLRLLKADL